MKAKKQANNWPAERKLEALQEYEALEEEESRGRCLRERGLYSAESPNGGDLLHTGRVTKPVGTGT